MSKSILYAVNTSDQETTATGTVLSFPTVVRKYGCNTYISGGNVITKGCGYYNIDTNLTITPTTAGSVIVTLYQNGVAIPGANATISGTADESISVSIPAIVRELCNCEKTITVVVSGVITNVSNSSILVEKL